MATHSSIFAWKVQQTEVPGGLQPMGSQSRTRLNYRAHTLGRATPWTGQAPGGTTFKHPLLAIQSETRGPAASVTCESLQTNRVSVLRPAGPHLRVTSIRRSYTPTAKFQEPCVLSMCMLWAQSLSRVRFL